MEVPLFQKNSPALKKFLVTCLIFLLLKTNLLPDSTVSQPQRVFSNICLNLAILTVE